jgi:hypothetical protein
MLLPFGIAILGPGGPRFDPAGVDPGGMGILVLGVCGIVLAARRWRTPDDVFVLAVLQVIGLAVIARMKFVYHYHLEIVVLMMVPLMALAIERARWRRVVLGLVIAAWGVNLFASLFRGKELDRAYQDLVMREAHARTDPSAVVWDGVGWALRRAPAYRYWFLPDLVRQLVRHGYAEPYSAAALLSDPPGVVIADQNALVWLSTQPELRRALVHHYIPLWRNLWIPAMNARLDASRPGISWIVPKDGDYRIYVSPALASHPWFSRPLFVGSYFGSNADAVEVRLGTPGGAGQIQWRIDGQVAVFGATVRLRRGQRLDAMSTAPQPVGLILLPGQDQRLFRQPPPGVTIDAAAPRTTHVPEFGAALE